MSDPRASAARLFAATGWPVDKRLKALERQARKAIEERAGCKANRAKGDYSVHYHDAEAARWAIDALRFCTTVCGVPPPEALVDFISHLLNVKDKSKGKTSTTKIKFEEAARYKAEHPEATASAIRRAIGFDQLRIIQGWLKNSDWVDRVEILRARKGVIKKDLLPPSAS